MPTRFCKKGDLLSWRDFGDRPGHVDSNRRHSFTLPRADNMIAAQLNASPAALCARRPVRLARSPKTTSPVRSARARRCKADASASDGSSVDSKKQVVAITGATGFVGKALVASLLEDGHEVRILTRNAISSRVAMPQAFLAGAKFYAWDTKSGAIEWYDAVKGCTGVVNLAGASISNPWNEQYKKTLVKSRLQTTKRIVDAINKLPIDQRPTLVSASAVGFYGISKKKEFDESSKGGNDFLANLCKQWEAAANKCDTTVTTLRTGVVLEKGGGAMGKILPVFQLYGGGPLGSGKQWVSWIHRDDLINLIKAALADPEKYEGVINGTAPEPATMNELCAATATATNRPNWLPVPGFALKLLLGEGATVVLDGQYVKPTKAKKLGFEFAYETVAEALDAIVN